ncbi:MAG: hypothetical protein ACJ8F1_24685 [Polyangia bacterium]
MAAALLAVHLGCTSAQGKASPPAGGSSTDGAPAGSSGGSGGGTTALDARPSFGVLMYPVISMDASIAHSGSRNALLGSNPTQAELTLYSNGAHGTWIRKATGDMAAWPDQCAAWLTKMKVTTAN